METKLAGKRPQVLREGSLQFLGSMCRQKCTFLQKNKTSFMVIIIHAVTCSTLPSYRSTRSMDLPEMAATTCHSHTWMLAWHRCALGSMLWVADLGAVLAPPTAGIAARSPHCPPPRPHAHAGIHGNLLQCTGTNIWGQWRSPWSCCRAAVDWLVSRGPGSIVMHPSPNCALPPA